MIFNIETSLLEVVFTLVTQTDYSRDVLEIGKRTLDMLNVQCISSWKK